MEASRMVVPNKGLTHAGVFHADDVFATALLRILNPSIEVVRDYVVPEDFDGIVYDIGGSEFDHHQSGARVRANGVPFASFGLLWERYGSQLLCEEDATIFDEKFVQPIDLSDNTQSVCELSLCVADFNPLQEANKNDFDCAFWQAVSWAQGILERRLNSVQAARETRDSILAAMSNGDGKVLVLEHYAPWKSVVVGSSYKYVIYPSTRGGYNVQCVPDNVRGGSPVLPLPREWRGLPKNELCEITGVADALFCHPSGYLASANSCSGAKKLAYASLCWRR